MSIVIDLNNFSLRTPEQMIRVFYSLHSHDSVKAELWEIFRTFATNDEKGVGALEESETRAALLFDHLISLVEAVEMLRQGVTDAERCVICGQIHSGRNNHGA